MYTVQYLSNLEFDSLPYKHVRESFGCADPKTNTAYVRKTGIKPLDMFVTDHELDELVAKVSPHEEDGIRYKKGSAVMQWLAPLAIGLLTGGTSFALAPWFGSSATGALFGAGAGAGIAKHRGQDPWMGAAGGALGGFGGAGMGRGFSAGWGGAPAGTGFMGKTAAGLKGAVGWGGSQAGGAPLTTTGGENIMTASTLPSNTLSSGLTSMGTQAGKTGALASQLGMTTGAPAVGGSAFGGGLAGTGATGSSLASSLGIGGAGGTAGAGGAGMGGLASQFGGTGALSTAGTQPGLIQKMLEAFLPQKAGGGTDWGRTAMGYGIPLIGGQFGPKVTPYKPTELPQYQQMQDLIAGGPGSVQITPERMTEITTQVTDEKDTALEQIKQRYKALRPGSDYLNDSDFQEEVQDLDQWAIDRQTEIETGEKQNLYNTQIQGLQQLLNTSTEELAFATGLSAQEAQNFQSWLQQIGSGILGGGSSLASLFNVGGA